MTAGDKVNGTGEGGAGVHRAEKHQAHKPLFHTTKPGLPQYDLRILYGNPERAGKTVGESSRVVLLNISHASVQCGQRMPALGLP